MKQTAVEWLVEQICTDLEMYDEYGNVSHVEFWNAFQSCTDLSEYIKQAKEMEKEQIINAKEDGHLSTYAEYGETPRCYLDGGHEQYYNETYKNTNT
jgi:hypothetical protein